MSETRDKKIIVFHVLEILKKYSDENHLLNYSAIMEKLSTIYDERPDIKTIASNNWNTY